MVLAEREKIDQWNKIKILEQTYRYMESLLIGNKSDTIKP